MLNGKRVFISKPFICIIFALLTVLAVRLMIEISSNSPASAEFVKHRYLVQSLVSARIYHTGVQNMRQFNPCARRGVWG
jgi:hypothetical protein